MSTQHQKFAAKTFAIGAGILIFIVAPISIYAALTVGKSVGVSVNLNNGLVGWWTFDGPNLLQNATDSSGQGNTGFLSGFTSTSTAVVPGPVGQALAFNGMSNYVSEPTSISNIQIVSFWAKASTTATIAQGLINFNGTSVYISTDASRAISATGFTSPVYYIDGIVSASPTLSNALWHHVVVTSAATITGSQVEIGRANSVLFGGSIDDVRFYNRILSANEITRLYGLGATAHVAVTPTTGLAASTTPSGGNNGLVGWWTFDGPKMLQNVADSSGNGNAGRLINFTSTSTAVVPGPVGQALTFIAASSQYITTSGTPVAPTVTLSAWIRPTTLPTFTGIISSAGIINSGYRMGTNSSVLTFTLGGVADYQCGGGTLVVGVWQFVTITASGNGGTRVCYLNGVQIDSDSIGTASSNTTYAIGVGNSQYFNGSIDDARIYNRVLSAAEVARLYGLGATTHVAVTPTTGLAASTTPSGGSNGLVGWWTFDGPNMLQNVADSSGNGNAGRLVGFTSTTTVSGRLGQALAFDGVNDYVSVGTPASLNNVLPLTYCAWVKPNSVSISIQGLIAKSKNSVPYGKHMILGTSQFALYADFSTIDVDATSQAGVVQAGIWQFLCGVIDSSNIPRLYYNGTEISSYAQRVTGTGSPNSDSGSSLQLGQRSSFDYNYFNGSIDDVRIYNRALTAAEVLRLYQTGQ